MRLFINCSTPSWGSFVYACKLLQRPAAPAAGPTVSDCSTPTMHAKICCISTEAPGGTPASIVAAAADSSAGQAGAAMHASSWLGQTSPISNAERLGWLA